ncbi:hypothetical protein V8D89_000848 [Ganoderma adspersum]
MQFSTVFVALAAYATLASAARVQFYTAKQCSGSSSEDYQNVQCNTCVDPPFGWASVQMSGIQSNQRWTLHNVNGCKPKSQVFQGYGDGCTNQGKTQIQSAYLNC